MITGCFQYVKFIKFESNSQLVITDINIDASCFQYVKFIKFESNSQHEGYKHLVKLGCFQYVKFIKFESNSQLLLLGRMFLTVVFSMSNL